MPLDDQNARLVAERVRTQVYAPVTIDKFLRCVIIVGWKLAQDEQVYLACVAEQLALRAIINEAEAILEADGKEFDFGDFELKSSKTQT